VKIPAGIDNGNGIRLTSEGDAGSHGGSPGNLYVVVSVAPHESFTRDGDNVLFELPLNFAQAALGTEVQVPTLYGDTKLKIPSGSQTGKIFRLKDKGIPHLNSGGRGDQMVIIRVVTPESLSKEQRKLFEELEKSLDTAKGWKSHS
jgi:molecular chaperone DnaJ